MKKLFLTAALIFGICVFANAQTSPDNDQTEQKTENVVAQNDFKDAQLTDLPAKVQEKIKTYTEEYTVKSLGFDAEKKQTRVVLTSNADQSEKTVILNEAGEEI